MRNRWKNTEAVESVSCGNFSIIPTCIIKLIPFVRSSRSSSCAMPSNTEGVLRSSSSVNNHCASLSARTVLGDLGGIFAAGCADAMLEDIVDMPGIAERVALWGGAPMVGDTV